VTIERINTRQNDIEIITFEQNSRPISSRKLRIQIGLMMFIGCLCLAAGLLLLNFPDPIGFMTGLGLLLPIPSCCYFAWRDYRGLQLCLGGR
jgi:hypothetical protein